jgi:hypothetical protein
MGACRLFGEDIGTRRAIAPIECYPENLQPAITAKVAQLANAVL